GDEHDRDVNAAVNLRRHGILALKAEGLSVSACGGLR
ncbi:MAG: transposase, partial [Boseongicola sp. SB0667_bin_21]|nr:transposase [Boseongicola sp. SB0667_bin_21]